MEKPPVREITAGSRWTVQDVPYEPGAFADPEGKEIVELDTTKPVEVTHEPPESSEYIQVTQNGKQLLVPRKYFGEALK